MFQPASQQCGSKQCPAQKQNEEAELGWQVEAICPAAKSLCRQTDQWSQSKENNHCGGDGDSAAAFAACFLIGDNSSRCANHPAGAKSNGAGAVGFPSGEGRQKFFPV